MKSKELRWIKFSLLALNRIITEELLSKLSLIPFSLRLIEQQFVDVSEVERGKNCGCVCPSCKTALISRQGKVNEWCFAHAAKGSADSIENECEFSFWVSIALMAKQIVSTAKSIKLLRIQIEWVSIAGYSN